MRAPAARSSREAFEEVREITIMNQKVLTVTYDPAFLRYDEAWAQVGQKVTLVDKWMQNCMLGGTVASKCTAGTTTPGMTTHEYTVRATSVKVTVPGTFDTVEIQRVEPVRTIITCSRARTAAASSTTAA